MATLVERSVREIVSGKVGMMVDEVTLESSFLKDLGADSLDMIEIVMSVEEEYKMEIPDEEAEKFRTVQDVVDYIEGYAAELGPEAA